MHDNDQAAVYFPSSNISVYISRASTSIIVQTYTHPKEMKHYTYAISDRTMDNIAWKDLQSLFKF